MVHIFNNTSDMEDYIREDNTIAGIGGGEDPFPFNIYYLESNKLFAAYKNANNTWTLLTDEV